MKIAGEGPWRPLRSAYPKSAHPRNKPDRLRSLGEHGRRGPLQCRASVARLQCPYFTLDSVSVAFGHLPLLDRVAFQVDRGERVAVIGRNGTGKSTLLKSSPARCRPTAAPSGGSPASSSRASSRTCRSPPRKPVFDVVAEGLGALSEVVTAYHHAAHDVAHDATPAALERLGRLQHELDERDGWRRRGARRDGPRSPRPAARRAGRHALRRLAPPRAAGARARRPARRARARRADQPPRHRCHRVARGLAARVSRRAACSSRTIASSSSASRRGSSSSIAAA